MKQQVSSSVRLLLLLILFLTIFGCKSQDQKDIHKLINHLSDESGIIRQNAMDALVEIGESTLSSLVQALNDSNKQCRISVASVLGQICTRA